jgi:two-component system response regulator FlrC
MIQPKILVVEDDLDLREALGDILQLAGYETIMVPDGLAALDAIDKNEPALVITDIQMPKMDGHTLLKNIKKRWPDIPVLLMTAYGSIQKAVEAMRDGAVDYLSKPFEAEVLVNMVSCYVKQIDDQNSHPMIISDQRSKNMAEVARRVASSNATVLISGESGCGKEVLARYIHQHSPRADKPFIAINCAAIPDNMLEATLFGYEKGAFTGAYKACPGKFEWADGGTMLLDEISEMDLALQAKLLRVLQEKEVERLGGNKMIKLDVRVLATSNRNMRDEVDRGRFREDLFYRLNVFPLYMPPLRERPVDILEIAKSLIIKHHSTQENASLETPKLSEEAISSLQNYSWPGNVRELENVIQRALIMRQNDFIEEQDLQFEQSLSSSARDHSLPTDFSPSNANEVEKNENLGDAVRSHEHSQILEALKYDGGNRKAVAEKLGISQRTLRYKIAKMRELGINVPTRYGMVHP